VEDIDRGRLIQERWFTAIRWLMVEVLFLQIHPELDKPLFTEPRAGAVFLAFALYTLLLTILVIARRRWPPFLAYVTAAADTIFATFIAASWSPAILTPGLIGVGASGVAIGARRFHIVDTFVFALIVELGLLGAHYLFYQYMPTDPFDFLVVTAIALLPVLTRAVALAPNPKSEDLVFQRLDEGATRVTSSLPSEGESTDAALFPPTAAALADYSDSQLGGVIVQKSEDQADLYTVNNGQMATDQLAVATQDQLAARLLAIREPTVLTRRDNLATAGLPDQFPTRLENLIVTPLNLSTKNAVLFAANRRGGPYRVEDRIIAALLGSEAARLKLAHDFAVDSSQALLAASDALLAAADAKRPGSRTQAEESARFAIAIAREMGWKENALEDIALASLLHDVGEIAIPDYLLEKTEQLTAEEFEIVKQHPRIAAKIIDPLNRSKLVLNSIYAHHERWDGRGYPGGLSGDAIPEGARILALAHSMDAMLSPKPYRAPLTPPEALQEIILGSGTQFDPTTVQAFLAVLKREGESFLQRREPVPEAQRTDITGFRG
jgi:HD-GYP domain-containing protein (c-di-GMP phosphodiesterase class II)